MSFNAIREIKILSKISESTVLSNFSYLQETPCEGIISRDINRTFPAHDYFKEAGGVGQDSLYKISKVI